MKFLCSKHRNWLAHSPTIARHVWHQYMLDARDAVRTGAWAEAVTLYGNAYEVADLLLDHDSFDTAAQTRYTYSTVDLACALSSQTLDLDWLIRSVALRLHNRPLADLSAQLLPRLSDIKIAPDKQQQRHWLAMIDGRSGQCQTPNLH